jgi:hypothetical protein
MIQPILIDMLKSLLIIHVVRYYESGVLTHNQELGLNISLLAESLHQNQMSINCSSSFDGFREFQIQI